MRPSGDTARGLVFDDFVDKQVVHVSATSFRSGAELLSMALNARDIVTKATSCLSHPEYLMFLFEHVCR